MVQRHYMSWDPESPRRIVRHMEGVLNHRLPSGLEAQIVRPFAQEPLGATELFVMEGGKFEGGNEVIPISVPSVIPKEVRGTTGTWSRRNFDFGQEVWLRECCRKERYGAVYDLCGHPVSTHAFAGIEWPGDEYPSFFELPSNTPMVYLSFAPVCDLDQMHANDKRRPALFTGVTDAEHPLVYILTPSFEESTPDGPRIYVVPSGSMRKTEERKRASQIVLQRKWQTANKVPVPLKFENTEFIDEFGIKRNDTVKWLRSNVFELDTESSTSLQTYRTRQREVVRHYLRVWDKEVLLPFQNRESLAASGK